jgi:hypothetical protein
VQEKAETETEGPAATVATTRKRKAGKESQTLI